ncbi:Butirosin biosynthesis, BtrG-like protein [Lasiosphaeria ovina]|uniref:gamma-glutamylcyclotransferase n=1 Tax=Lasiosphaeria ovina TaxID=92902 RepID=A0AAE0TXU9_9PEZI|nr:Butirosin biosynthesis, BtrG-like protein [Lasiosphaeria ovina]
MTVPVAGKAYFGYGSNLWREQMALRCPASPFVGVGRLRGYRWFINRRGYANIKETGVDTDEVWGLVYQLVPADEARLDKNEGVPHAYRKRMIPVEFSAANQTTAETVTTSRDMLVYIDSKRTSENHRPKDEYVHRLNSGIDDALYEGVPPSYVDHVLRKYIPTEEDVEAGLMGFMEGLSD